MGASCSVLSSDSIPLKQLDIHFHYGRDHLEISEQSGDLSDDSIINKLFHSVSKVSSANKLANEMELRSVCSNVE